MISQLELDSRAALCRQLANREPAHRAFWIAEAERWSRLSKGNLHGDTGQHSANAVMARARSGFFSHRLRSCIDVQ
jgi:hypothetical protein